MVVAAVDGSSLWSRLPVKELEDALAGDSDSPESEKDSGDDSLSVPLDPSEPPTDEMAQRLIEREARLTQTVDRLKRRRKRLREKLSNYEQKEKEFVHQMDSHMDEVEQSEQALTSSIEQLTQENGQLRDFTDKRARDNAQLAEKLAETTKQCQESETRVQFLVDRIVALLSAGSADPQQTQDIVQMRQREREMLRQLDEARQQYDEVRQQNGELTSRLTEELALSRRLSDQLQEVEERFFHHRPDQPPGASLPEGGPLAPSLPARAGAGRLYGSLRSDQTESPPERPSLPELPPPISEDAEDPCRSPLDVVPEADVSAELSPDPSETDAIGQRQLDDPSMLMDAGMAAGGRDPSFVLSAGGGENVVPNGDDPDKSAADLMRPHGGLMAPGRAYRTSQPRHTSIEDVMLMEEKLREALDRASFECAVIRVETGIYSFGDDTRAMVELTADGEVVAAREGEPWEPIDVFIGNIASDSRDPRFSGVSAHVAAVPPAGGMPQVPVAATGPAAVAQQQHGVAMAAMVQQLLPSGGTQLQPAVAQPVGRTSQMKMPQARGIQAMQAQPPPLPGQWDGIARAPGDQRAPGEPLLSGHGSNCSTAGAESSLGNSLQSSAAAATPPCRVPSVGSDGSVRHTPQGPAAFASPQGVLGLHPSFGNPESPQVPQITALNPVSPRRPGLSQSGSAAAPPTIRPMVLPGTSGAPPGRAASPIQHGDAHPPPHLQQAPQAAQQQPRALTPGRPQAATRTPTPQPTQQAGLHTALAANRMLTPRALSAQSPSRAAGAAASAPAAVMSVAGVCQAGAAMPRTLPPAAGGPLLPQQPSGGGSVRLNGPSPPRAWSPVGMHQHVPSAAAPALQYGSA